MQQTLQTSNRPSASKEAHDHAEGTLTYGIENQMAKLPSDVWLGAAASSIGLALSLKLLGKHQGSLFVGQWAAPLLLFGVYLKLVKISGSDRVQR